MSVAIFARVRHLLNEQYNFSNSSNILEQLLSTAIPIYLYNIMKKKDSCSQALVPQTST